MICMVTLMNACVNKSLVVLLPDQDGKTGVIEIRNQSGSQKLDAPNQATTIGSIKTAPDTPVIMHDNQVKKIFGEAMAAMPPVPEHYTLYFLSDSTQLSHVSIRIFEDVIASIDKIKPAEISVVGHTDRVGARHKNFRLGYDRATQIKHLLIQRGIDAGIIEVTSHGEDNPLIKTIDEVAEPKNRRVEIVIR